MFNVFAENARGFWGKGWGFFVRSVSFNNKWKEVVLFMCGNGILTIFNIVVDSSEKYKYMPECRTDLYYLYCFSKVKICKIQGCGLGEYFYLCKNEY